jgi:isocitrate lyase
VVKKINNALRRADQIQVLDNRQDGPYWFAPIVADAEAGFGGPLNAFEPGKGGLRTVWGVNVQTAQSRN